VNLTPFQELLAALDAALTKKDDPTVRRTAGAQAMTPEDLYGGIYYLSDGGYSRLIFSADEGRLLLTSDSLAGPVASWDDCRDRVAAVEAAMRRWMEGAG
jgi:hypothetical protein